MTFIATIPENGAEGAAAAMYARMRQEAGYIPNFVTAFSHRPEVLDCFDKLLDSIRRNMDLHRYELVTLAAARALRSSYCMLAHGSVMLREFYDAEQLRTIAEDPEGSTLDEADKAVMRFAAKVVHDAASITAADVEGLRSHGLSEADIFDVAAAASERCFLSKTADALGAIPDARYRALDPELQKVLVVGRPIAE
jgi:uncharacterized peroxidase-related enzyme